MLKTSFEILGIAACVPKNSVDNRAALTALYGDAAKAEDVVKATGIESRRIAASGTTSLDLCVAAAKRLMAGMTRPVDRVYEGTRPVDRVYEGTRPVDRVYEGTRPVDRVYEGTRPVDRVYDIGAVISVSFTPARAMPGNAHMAQKLLGLPESVLAFDVGLACSGYVYGLYLASLLADQTQKLVLLLDGDVQSAHVSAQNAACLPVLADAGSATLIAPGDAYRASFAFLAKGAGGEALTCTPGGEIAMDGFGVFRFVAGEVSAFLKGFLADGKATADDFAAFVPHQANLYMVRQLGKSLGFAPDRVWTSAENYGNPASASVPLTLATVGATLPHEDRRLLVAGFGGGLSAAACDLTLPGTATLSVFDCD